MKRIILVTLAMVAAVITTAAQNRNINFESTKEWKEIVRKAKEGKKLIFVDCYASWCGPCKMLDKNVFTNNEVADFFNANFINAKFDMEKDGDGVQLKKQFGVKLYPTLLFIDSTSGEVIHSIVGVRSPEALISEAKLAMKPDGNLNSLMKRYAAGEKDAEFIKKYVPVLYSAYMRNEAARVAGEYLYPLPVDSLATPENWQLINRYVSDPLSPLLKRVMDEREKIGAIAGREQVNYKLEKSIYAAVKELTDWKPDKKRPFNENRNRELTDYLLNSDFVAAPAGLAALYTAKYAREKDYRGLLDKMNEVLSSNLFRDGMETGYFLNNIGKLKYCDDKALVEEGIQWIDRFLEQTTNAMDKSNLMRAKARLQTKTGDRTGAEISNQEASNYLKKRKN